MFVHLKESDRREEEDVKQWTSAWGKATLWVLASVELLLFVLAFLQLLHIIYYSRNSRFQFLAKKVFHGVICVFCLVRATFFIINATTPTSEVFVVSWLRFGDLLFFTAYVMLLMFWFDFYYILTDRSGGSFFAEYKVALISGFIAIAIPIVAFFVVLIVVRKDKGHVDVLDTVSEIFILLCGVALAAAFLLYGIRLHHLLNHLGFSLTAHQRRIVFRWVIISAACFLLFMIRASWCLFDAYYYQKKSSLYLDEPPWLSSIHYFVFDIIPVTLMLLLMSKKPVKVRPASSTRTPTHKFRLVMSNEKEALAGEDHADGSLSVDRHYEEEEAGEQEEEDGTSISISVTGISSDTSSLLSSEETGGQREAQCRVM